MENKPIVFNKEESTNYFPKSGEKEQVFFVSNRWVVLFTCALAIGFWRNTHKSWKFSFPMNEKIQAIVNRKMEKKKLALPAVRKSTKNRLDRLKFKDI
jgi:hypothetical protein